MQKIDKIQKYLEDYLCFTIESCSLKNLKEKGVFDNYTEKKQKLQNIKKFYWKIFILTFIIFNLFSKNKFIYIISSLTISFWVSFLLFSYYYTNIFENFIKMCQSLIKFEDYSKMLFKLNNVNKDYLFKNFEKLIEKMKNLLNNNNSNVSIISSKDIKIDDLLEKGHLKTYFTIKQEIFNNIFTSFDKVFEEKEKVIYIIYNIIYI
jgi:hypothetical protein